MCLRECARIPMLLHSLASDLLLSSSPPHSLSSLSLSPSLFSFIPSLSPSLPAGWWTGGGAGSSSREGLQAASGESALGHFPGGSTAPGYVLPVGRGGSPSGPLSPGGPGQVQLSVCSVPNPLLAGSGPGGSFQCPAATSNSTLLFTASSGTLQSLPLPAGLAAIWVQLWGAGGSPGRYCSSSSSCAQGGHGAYLAGLLPPPASASSLLVLVGGGGRFSDPGPPPLGGAAFSGFSGFAQCSGSGAGASAVGLASAGGAPAAVAGAGGTGGERSGGGSAAWNASSPVSFSWPGGSAPNWPAPCLGNCSCSAWVDLHGQGGSAGGASGPGAPGCGSLCCGSNGSPGSGPLNLTGNPATGGLGAKCGGAGGGGYYGGGGGGECVSPRIMIVGASRSPTTLTSLSSPHSLPHPLCLASLPCLSPSLYRLVDWRRRRLLLLWRPAAWQHCGGEWQRLCARGHQCAWLCERSGPGRPGAWHCRGELWRPWPGAHHPLCALAHLECQRQCQCACRHCQWQRQRQQQRQQLRQQQWQCAWQQ